MWIFHLLVFFMSTQVLAQENIWQKYNSSLLIEVTRPTGVFTCTGVAVSKTLLLTAAHCLDGEVNKVRVFTQEVYDPKNPFLTVRSFELHPGYNSQVSRYRNDIAKLFLKDDLPDDIVIQPIHQGRNLDGKIYRFGFGARGSQNIRTVITPTFRKYNEAESELEMDDTFSYSGDSGGPLFLTKGNTVELLAIHSTFSYGPEGRFSFNPLVASYLPWIFPN